MQLQSKIVFLDTNIYISKNYQFLTHSLGAIKGFCDEDEILLIVTDITSSEVKSHIHDESVETSAYLRKAKKELMLLRNLPGAPAFGVFTNLSVGDIENKLLADWDSFVTGEGVEIISVDGVAPSRVFERYFSSESPFAKGAKEKEFADAFVLERLVDLSVERAQPIHVISTDKDLEKFCVNQPALIFSDSVDEFIDAVNLSVSVEPAALASEALNKVKEQVLSFIQEGLPDVDYAIRSSDWDAQLEDVNIQHLELIKANLVSVARDQCLYELECAVVIETVESVKDYDRSPFDHEDDSYPFVLESEVIRTFDPVISVEVTIYYPDKLLEKVEFDVDMPYGMTLSNPIDEKRRELDIDGE
ncbi:PIN domain-containing protein [Pseudomonas yamanorum]|uniref:DUF4935 domain-containing protein n=1 Tax=Pseudomonas yamanorum TaxID=515393 RepID=A0A7Y8JNU9_9PSED|nr:DUF4935 domain-containing protein [Pseudomonas yamanorum]